MVVRCVVGLVKVGCCGGGSFLFRGMRRVIFFGEVRFFVCLFKFLCGREGLGS